MARNWNDREITNRVNMDRVMAKPSTEATKQTLVSRLNEDLEEFFGHGGEVEQLPPCQCAIDARTNKPFQRGCSQQGAK